MSKSEKILVCGNVLGNFSLLFSKVESINNTRGPFEALYCVGNFFGTDMEEYDNLKSGNIRVPIYTYILNGNQKKFKELFEPLRLKKLSYLGKMGSITGTSGLKIAYLSGVELPDDLHGSNKDKDPTFDKYNIYISRRLVKHMINIIGADVDILLTSMWPKDVSNYAVDLDKTDMAKVDQFSSYFISYLAKYLKPRYHFCGLADLFYERIPYRNHIDLYEPPTNETRFFGLASLKYGKVQPKEKWLYAFTITPRCFLKPQELLNTPGHSTCSPYGKLTDDDFDKHFGDGNFFFDTAKQSSSSSSKRHSNRSDSESQSKKPAIGASTCWFCLSNENVEKNLIAHIGKHCYVTAAKGALVPDHCFIVPINHIASTVELPLDALKEAEQFKLTLATYFHNTERDVVFFERNYRSPHLQIQAVPIPKRIHSNVENKLYSYARSFQLNSLPELATLKQLTPEKKYFYFELLVDKRVDGKYLALIENSVKDFPLQIGRQILADVLGVKDRANWMDCVQVDEDEENARKLRDIFKTYLRICLTECN